MAWRNEPGPLSAVVVTIAAHPQGERNIATAKTNGSNVLMVGLRFSIPRRALKQNKSLSDGSVFLTEVRSPNPAMRVSADAG
jgi:hypothetical protein